MICIVDGRDFLKICLQAKFDTFQKSANFCVFLASTQRAPDFRTGGISNFYFFFFDFCIFQSVHHFHLKSLPNDFSVLPSSLSNII